MDQQNEGKKQQKQPDQEQQLNNQQIQQRQPMQIQQKNQPQQPQAQPQAKQLPQPQQQANVQAQQKQQNKVDKAQQQVINDDKLNENNQQQQLNNNQQQGQISQQQHQQQKEQQPIIQKMPQKQKLNIQSYVNILEKNIFNLAKTNQNLNYNLKNQIQKVQTLEQQKLDYLKLKKKNQFQIKKLNLLKNKQQKQKDKYKQQCTMLNQQIQEYKQYGDLIALKDKIRELETFNNAYEGEINLLKSQLQQPAINMNTNISKIQQFEILEQQNSNLKSKLEQTQQQLQNKQNQLSTINQEWQAKKNQYEEKIQTITNEKAQLIQQTQEKQEKLRDQLNKLKEQFITKTMNQNSHAFTLSLKEQKEILMREYIQIQIQHNELKTYNKQLKEKYFNLMKETKLINSMRVNKRQYDDIVKRYQKSKKCLENSIKQIKRLRQQIDRKSQQHIEPLSDRIQQQFKQSQIEGQQNSHFHNTIKKHQLTFLDQMKQFYSLEENGEILTLQNELKESKDQITKLNKQIQQSKKILNIKQKQIQLKNLIMNKYKGKFKNYQNQIKQYMSTNDQYNNSIRQAKRLKTINHIQEMYNLALNKQNKKTKKQIQQYKLLYQNVKIQYLKVLEEKNQIRQFRQQANPVLQQNIVMEIEGQKQNQQKINQHQQCVQCKSKLSNIQLSIQQSQTQGLNEFYYKQIKQLMMILKKLPKKADTLLKNLEESKLQLQTLKSKYDTQNEKLNVKFRKLKTDEGQLENYKIKIRQEIKQQFEEIKELIENEKLINALRRAKYLIEQLEKNNEEEVQQKQNEEDKQKQKEVA